MKLPTLAVATFTLAAFVGGTAIAQMAPPVTMQPIPNPPESGMSHGTMHHHMRHRMRHHHLRHHMRHHHMMKKSAKTGADTTAAPMNSTPPTTDTGSPPPQ
jgi:hypothetical protein